MPPVYNPTQNPLRPCMSRGLKSGSLRYGHAVGQIYKLKYKPPQIAHKTVFKTKIKFSSPPRVFLQTRKIQKRSEKSLKYF